MKLNKPININYTIPAQSDLFLATEWWKYIPSKSKGVYCLYDKDKKLIYIGKSVASMRQRVNSHISQDISEYTDDYNKKLIQSKRDNSIYASYAIIKDKEMIGFIEGYLISKLSPPLNVKKDYYLP